MSRKAPGSPETARLEIKAVDYYRSIDGVDYTRLITDWGDLECRLHRSEGVAAALFIGGAGGGLSGPAGGIYMKLAEELRPNAITSLRLDYRHPSHLRECVLDALCGIDFLSSIGKKEVVLVGHSFGGAVAVSAAAADSRVIAVAALSTQSYGTHAIRALHPRPLLLIHGQEDDVFPATCSTDIFRRAKEPKKLIIYPGCRHGLDECAEELERDIMRWFDEVFRFAAQWSHDGRYD